MSEALKANTTLTALTLWGVNKLDKTKQCNNMSISEQTGNEIGAEGARALSGALKVNTTLTTLNLSGNIRISLTKLLWYVDERSKSRHKKPINTENWIYDKGARALSDALKTNTTLQSLDLGRVQE